MQRTLIGAVTEGDAMPLLSAGAGDPKALTCCN